MSFELTVLFWSTVLGLVYLVVQALFYQAQVGTALMVGSRDDIPDPEKIAARAARALRNFLETFPVFVALVAIVELGDKSDVLTQAGAGLYLAMRIAYLPLCLGGVPLFRSIVWNLATYGLVLMIAGVWF